MAVREMTKNASPARTRNTVTAPDNMSPPIPSGLDPEGETVHARDAHPLAATERMRAAGADAPGSATELALPDAARTDVVEHERFLADDGIHRPRLGRGPVDDAAAQRH